MVCRAIHTVLQGRTYFSKSIAARLQHFNAERASGKQAFSTHAKTLTSRETEVLQLVAEGHANKQIADDLCISIKTVEKHRTSLMKKLNIHDTAGLTRYAIDEGVIENSKQSTIA
jgi:DNA-binding NarL/FixJ family response regulator